MKPRNRPPFHSTVLAIVLLFSFHLTLSSGGEIYKWVDDDGTVHMTDNPASVPPKYKNQSQKKTLQTTAEPEAAQEFRSASEIESATGSSPDLKRIALPFKAFEGSARRIILPVTFNNSVTAQLLLDTGAPGLTIAPKLADRLGLINEKDGNLRIMTGGIGGTVPAMLAIVDSVSVGEARGEFLPALITEIPSDEFEGLVGMDFMANYRISIDNEKHVIVFDELPPQVNRPGGHDETWWRSNFLAFSKLIYEWKNYLKALATVNLTSSETDRVMKIAKTQSSEAERMYHMLESYAREKAVPVTWKR
jgi:hypothetical protein